MALYTYVYMIMSWIFQQTDDEIRLLRLQRKLEQETNRKYIDLSLQCTVQCLLKEQQHKWAEQLRKDFKIPDRRLVRALRKQFNIYM